VSEFWESFFSVPNSQIKATIIIVCVLIIAFAALKPAFKKLDPASKTPLWAVPFVWLVDLINGFVKNNIGKRWKSYAPWFLSLTIILFFSNIAGVFTLNSPTSYILVTFSLAMCSFMVIQITGIISMGLKGYIKSFFDPFFVMLPINIVSEISLPISLAVRLFGNIISGTAISILIKELLGYGAIPVMPFINAIFDIAFGVIQVAVFVILSIIFTSMKVVDEEKIY
jgi:F-type H+-transporting ATPase subunit a